MSRFRGRLQQNDPTHVTQCQFQPPPGAAEGKVFGVALPKSSPPTLQALHAFLKEAYQFDVRLFSKCVLDGRDFLRTDADLLQAMDMTLPKSNFPGHFLVIQAPAAAPDDGAEFTRTHRQHESTRSDAFGPRQVQAQNTKNVEKYVSLF